MCACACACVFICKRQKNAKIDSIQVNLAYLQKLYSCQTDNSISLITPNLPPRMIKVFSSISVFNHHPSTSNTTQVACFLDTFQPFQNETTMFVVINIDVPYNKERPQ